MVMMNFGFQTTTLLPSKIYPWIHCPLPPLCLQPAELWARSRRLGLAGSLYIHQISKEGQ